MHQHFLFVVWILAQSQAGPVLLLKLAGRRGEHDLGQGQIEHVRAVSRFTLHTAGVETIVLMPALRTAKLCLRSRQLGLWRQQRGSGLVMQSMRGLGWTGARRQA